MKNLRGFKREILRCAQNDKNSLLIAHWYNTQINDIWVRMVECAQTLKIDFLENFVVLFILIGVHAFMNWGDLTVKLRR